ncbi:MAG: hypothetical protein IT215_00055 [Chitinophagaceae bacterium]|nr:hypothetical protein [Chitinophagaceae bacterium]
MTKKDFMAGCVFKGTSNIEFFKFEKNENKLDARVNIVGSISIKRVGSQSWEYYANVEKVNGVSASIYFFGIRKLQKERIIFNDLEKIGGSNE